MREDQLKKNLKLLDDERKYNKQFKIAQYYAVSVENAIPDRTSFYYVKLNNGRCYEAILRENTDWRKSKAELQPIKIIPKRAKKYSNFELNSEITRLLNNASCSFYVHDAMDLITEEVNI